MSREFDPLTSYRVAVALDLESVVNDVRLIHVDILKHELKLIGQGRPTGRVDLSAPGACLMIAEALGAPQEQALPLASALAFMQTMASIFRELEADDVHGGESLETIWGLPRTVNAGDAFFVLAQQSVLRDTGIDEDRLFAATAVLGAASRLLAEELFAGRGQSAYRLLPQALALGAIAAGCREDVARELREFGEAAGRESFDAAQARIQGMAVGDRAKSRLEELTAFMARGR